MKCDLKDRLLSLYFDGRCSGALRLKIERHLTECPLCQERLSSLRQMSTALKGLSGVDISSSYDFEFQKRLTEAEEGLGSYPFPGRERVSAILEGLESIASRIRVVQPVPVLARVAVVILLAIALSLPMVFYFRPAPSKVILARGFAQVYNPKTGYWMDVEAGHRVTKNSIIKTGESSHIDIGVLSKYKIRLEENSEMQMANLTGTRNSPITTYKLGEGLILAGTEPGFKEAKLNIHTPAAEATIYGTKFLIDVEGKKKATLAVLEGEVEFAGIYEEEARKRSIIVKEGCESTVLYNEAPSAPVRLSKKNSKRLLDIYDIGRPGRIASSIEAAKSIKYDDMVVVLIMPDIPDRAEWFLARGHIWTNDREPKQVNRLLKEVNKLRTQGDKEQSIEKHLQAIAKLEGILSGYPDYRYNSQVLLFAGAYYEILLKHDRAFEKFQEVITNYRETEIACIAQYAIGIIYEDKLKDEEKARAAYYSVITNYPGSPEAVVAKNRLARLEVK